MPIVDDTDDLISLKTFVLNRFDIDRPYRSRWAFSRLLLPILRGGNAPGDNGSPVTVAGWGTTRERGRVADVLRAVQLETMNNKKCKKSYSWIGSGQVIKH